MFFCVIDSPLKYWNSYNRNSNDDREKLIQVEKELIESRKQISSKSIEFEQSIKRFTMEKQELQAKLSHFEAVLKSISIENEKNLKEKLELQMKLSNSEANLKSTSIQSETYLKEKQDLFKENQNLQRRLTDFQTALNSIEEEKERKRKSESENQELADFLNLLGLSQLFAKFQSEHIEIETFEEMKEEDLKELGLTMGQRKKILSAIKKGTCKRMKK